jgi:5'-nucleotidase
MNSSLQADANKVLVVGISGRALFDLSKENQIFETEGLPAYRQYQLDHEDEILAPGPAFPLVKAMLRLNAIAPGNRRCEVVILSKNSPDLSLRLHQSIVHHDLDITRSGFTSGVPVSRYLHAFGVDLYLSRNHQDVRAGIAAGVASGVIYEAPREYAAAEDEIRVAFDADAVLFSDESERIYKERGLTAFLEHEKENARKPMKEGPFSKLFRAIAVLQAQFVEKTPIRTAIVTARNSPANERVIRTLRAWNVRVDETFFLGTIPKDQVLQAFGAHIFFDDQDRHVAPASQLVPSALVPQPT